MGNIVTTVLIHPLVKELPATFVNNVFSPPAVNGSLWTLRAEFPFYLLVAMLGYFGLLNKKNVLILCMLTICLNLVPFHQLVISQVFELFAYFSTGMVVYVFRNHIPLNRFLAIIAFIVLLIASQYGGFKEIFIICGSYLVFYTAFNTKVKFNNFAKYGDFSYGIYIFAFPIQQTVTNFFGGKMVPMLNFIIAYPITLICAFISWHIIEKRALRFKYSHKKSTTFHKPLDHTVNL